MDSGKVRSKIRCSVISSDVTQSVILRSESVYREIWARCAPLKRGCCGGCFVVSCCYGRTATLYWHPYSTLCMGLHYSYQYISKCFEDDASGALWYTRPYGGCSKQWKYLRRIPIQSLYKPLVVINNENEMWSDGCLLMCIDDRNTNFNETKSNKSTRCVRYLFNNIENTFPLPNND